MKPFCWIEDLNCCSRVIHSKLFVLQVFIITLHYLNCAHMGLRKLCQSFLKESYIVYSLSTPSMNKNANYFSFSHNKDCLNFFIVFVKGAWTHSYSTWYSKVMAINIYTVSKNIDILNHITMRMPKDHEFVVAVYK